MICFVVDVNPSIPQRKRISKLKRNNSDER